MRAKTTKFGSTRRLEQIVQHHDSETDRLTYKEAMKTVMMGRTY